MKPQNRGRILGSVVAVCAVLGAVAFAVPRFGARAPTPAASATTTHARAPVVYEPDFPVGRRATYSVVYRTEALIDGRMERRPRAEGAPKEDSVLALSSVFEGNLTTTVLERRLDGSARVLASLTDLRAELQLNGRPADAPSEAFDALARGFFVDYAPNGAVLGLSVAEDAPAVAARLAAQLVGFLQLVTPKAPSRTWETDESDAAGALHARYEWVDDPPSREGDRVLRKTVTRRSTHRGSGALGRLLESGGSAEASTLAYEVSPARGMLVEAAGALSTAHALGDLRVGGEDSTLLVLLVNEETLAPPALRDLVASIAERSDTTARPLDPAKLRDDERRRDHEALLGRVDLPAVLADARAHPPPPQSQDAATYARLLIAAIEVSPEGRARLERALLDTTLHEDAFLPIARAFGDVGSVEAQAILARAIAGRPPRDPGREIAIHSLSRVEAPTDATLALFESLASDARDPHVDTALFGLGRLVGQLAAIAPARGTPALDRLLARLRDAPDDAERARMLEALGNAGSPHVEPELARLRRSESRDVREAAVRAHRLVPTNTARATLLDAMVHDPEASVRHAALEAILLRRPDDAIADAVADRLERDPSEAVKKPAASRLMSLCRRSPRACQHVERLKETGDAWTRRELAAFAAP